MADKGWHRTFDDPIALPDGNKLRFLGDVSISLSQRGPAGCASPGADPEFCITATSAFPNVETAFSSVPMMPRRNDRSANKASESLDTVGLRDSNKSDHIVFAHIPALARSHHAANSSAASSLMTVSILDLDDRACASGQPQAVPFGRCWQRTN